MRNLFAYITICILFSTFSRVVSSVLKPKLSIISPKGRQLTLINGKVTIDVRSNSTLHLKCNGSQPIYWIFPDNDPDSPPIERVAKITSTCIRNRKPMVCESEAIVQNLNYRQTGSYACHYSHNTTYVTVEPNYTDQLYVFVNDAINLLVPVEGNDDFIIVPLFSNRSRVVIPCKPTDSRARVTIHSVDPNSGHYQSDPLRSEHIKFDPTIGFNISDFNVTEDYSAIDCKAKLGNREQFSSVALHVITKTYRELFPYIEVSSNVTNVGDDLSLNCLVHIPENIYAILAWDVDYTNPRIVDQPILSERYESQSGSYVILSKMVTIVNTTADDYGVYTCKVTDSGDNTHTISKEIVAKNLANARFNMNTSHLNIYHFNHFASYIFLIYLIVCRFNKTF